MRKSVIRIAIAALIWVLAAGSASAVTLGLNSSQLLQFGSVFLSANTALVGSFLATTDESAYGTPLSGGVGFTATLDAVGGPGVKNILHDIGVSGGGNVSTLLGGSNDVSGFSDYRLAIFNDNDDDWTVAVFVISAGDGKVTSSSFTLSPGEKASPSLNLAGLSDTSLTGIGIRISATLDGVGGNPSDPDAYHISVAEPTSLFLLGFGLMGLGFLGRRKQLG